MFAIELIANTLHVVRRRVKLRIPFAAQLEGPVGLKLHNLDSRALVLPYVEVGGERLQRTGLGQLGGFDILGTGGVGSALIKDCVPAFDQSVFYRGIGDQFIDLVTGKYLL